MLIGHSTLSMDGHLKLLWNTSKTLKPIQVKGNGVLNVYYHPSSGVINVLSDHYHLFDEVISVLNVYYHPSRGVINVLSDHYQPFDEVISVNYNFPNGLLSLLSVNYYPSYVLINVLSVNYYPSYGIISVLSVNYHPSGGLISVLSDNYYPSDEFQIRKCLLLIKFKISKAIFKRKKK